MSLAEMSAKQIDRHNESLRKAVAKGAALLDKKGPTGWFRKIKVRQLDMTVGDSCILGQLYSSYFEGCNQLGLVCLDDTNPENKSKCAGKYGFEISEFAADHGCSDNDYAVLADAWKAEIKARKKPATPETPPATTEPTPEPDPEP